MQHALIRPLIPHSLGGAEDSTRDSAQCPNPIDDYNALTRPCFERYSCTGFGCLASRKLAASLVRLFAAWLCVASVCAEKAQSKCPGDAYRVVAGFSLQTRRTGGSVSLSPVFDLRAASRLEDLLLL